MTTAPMFTGNRPAGKSHEPRKAATYRGARRNAAMRRRQTLARAKRRAFREWRRRNLLDHRYFHGPRSMREIDLTGLHRLNF